MKQHEREYFISRIRSGCYKIDADDETLTIIPATIEQEFELNIIFQKKYIAASEEGMMTHEELLESLSQRGLWTEDDEKKSKGYEQDLEKLKVECYLARNDAQMKKRIKHGIKICKEQYNEHISKKYFGYENTCDGLASAAKMVARAKFCTRDKQGELFTFDEDDGVQVEQFMTLYSRLILSETQVRELARSEPWRSIWILGKTKTFDLFANSETLNSDQSNLLSWSTMYDNVAESPDSPPEDVVEDDDMLDGWFIVQRRKQEQEKAEADMESRNSKIANSEEQFIVARSETDVNRINSANNYTAKKVKQQRQAVINKQGVALDADFQDQKLKLQQMRNEQFKGKFRR